jgi:solute:Na+ symporter, SSS family
LQIKIETLDLVIIIAYLVGIVGLGCWVGMRRHKGKGSGKDYFLAGGTLTWPVIGLALFSTNISTIHLVSLAQEGYDNGLVYGNLEWMAPFTLIILALFFAPFYIRSKVATLPDFLEQRYDRGCRDWLAVLSIFSAIFLHIAFSLFTGAKVLEGMFGMPLLVSIVLTASLTGLYTIIGGLTAVVVTESIQTVVLLFGAICITAIGLHSIGGWSGLRESVDPVMLTVLRPKDDPSNLPWYAVLLGYPVIGIWYWCADQTIVQRVLGAKDENHARVGPLFAGFIKILPVFIFVLPGLICLGLVRQGKLDESKMENMGIPARVVVDGEPVAVGNGRLELEGKTLAVNGKAFDLETAETHIEEGVLYVDGKPVKDTLDTYGFMIREMLPIGLRGLIAAALLAALMGTVSGALNSVATLFSYDLLKRWRPETGDRTLVLVGRIVTFVAMLMAMAWSPFLERFGSVFQGINSMICYIAPPITTVFLWGVLWRRGSARAARLTLYAGSALGLCVFLLDFFKVDISAHLASMGMAGLSQQMVAAGLGGPWKVLFMMSAFYLFCICSGLYVLLSLVWPHKHTPESQRLVWSNPLAALQGDAWPGLGNYKVLAALLTVSMLILYAVFR